MSDFWFPSFNMLSSQSSVDGENGCLGVDRLVGHDVPFDLECFGRSIPLVSVANLHRLRLLIIFNMRAFGRLLATPSSVGTQGRGFGKPVPLALLPPIPLYRRILRGHRKYLPREMRVLGDEYVKSEFRAHRNVENPVHIIGFLSEWQGYAQQVEGDNWRGEKMDKSKVDKMSDQQIGQMYELMRSIAAKEGGEEFDQEDWEAGAEERAKGKA